LITISNLSQNTGLSSRIIRHYTSIGLIQEIKSRDKKYCRTYSDDTVYKLNIIIMLRELGFNLNEIGNLIGKPLTNTVDFKVKKNSKNKKELIKELIQKKKNIDFVMDKLGIK